MTTTHETLCKLLSAALSGNLPTIGNEEINWDEVMQYARQQDVLEMAEEGKKAIESGTPVPVKQVEDDLLDDALEYMQELRKQFLRGWISLRDVSVWYRLRTKGDQHTDWNAFVRKAAKAGCLDFVTALSNVCQCVFNGERIEYLKPEERRMLHDILFFRSGRKLWKTASFDKGSLLGRILTATNYTKRMTLIMTMAVAALSSVACKSSQEPREIVPAINLSNLDTTVAPGADFYDYATAGWRRANPLKPEYSRYGSFDILGENNEIRLNELFKSLAGMKTKKGTDEQKLADLYTMGLDSTRLNAEGAAPVKKYIDMLEEVTDLEGFAIASGQMALAGERSIYGLYVEADMMDSDNHALYLGESGLAMRNRDYYLLPENAELREGYKAFLEKVFTLAGVNDAAQRAQDAFDVEMAIAVPFWSMVQQRDVEAQYNPMSSEQICERWPSLHFDKYLAELCIPKQDKVIVEQPSYFDAINQMFTDADGAKLRHYLQASLLRSACGRLSDEFSDASFEFFSRQMAGIQEQKPRWKRAMAMPNMALGEAVGKMYVAKYFPQEDKDRMLQIVKNIQTALGEHVAALEWMSDETKAKAQEKLSSFTIKIGFPDKWKDYSSLTIDPAKSYYDNCLAVARWSINDNLSKLGKPVDKEEWGMSPQTVNAYYNPTTNEICFPAGILQPPFYNSDADDAVNYGAIGVVISHEMTHGFDDQGRLFDKDGNMNNWWTEADAEAFNQKAAVLVKQFDEIEVLPGVHANGAATLGENIADHGGLRIAYSAMLNSFGGSHPEPIDGFTAEQRFYLAYATLWAQNITDKEIARRTLTDVHSIGRNRVNASLRNLDTFFEAFGIKEGDAMYRPESERVIIW